ncbi:MAG: methyltransferase domain-containing protein [Candidatus Omnitrophica bacterium]|jgi:ubiquinone/menaquinone biosynthesis C-methylase UbiE/uncharacterized protein YbaR (Trm112 family)|nr:methyltransferase domain-containing protein [Candidatus Omnitrophota bacterium]
MRRNSLALIVCPNCKSEYLEIKEYESSAENILEGYLVCTSCKVWYRIENGIVDLLPLNLRRVELYRQFADRHKLVLEIPQEILSVPKDKAGQISFFKNNLEDYEQNVVNSNYYQALDAVVFTDWIKANLKVGDIVLDAGCGTARQSILLAQHKANVMGLDICEEMLTLAKDKVSRLGLDGLVDFFIADAANPPFKNNSFNACILYGTLHHLPNKQDAINKVSKKLIPHGYFYSLDPNDSPLRFIFDFMMRIWKLYNEDASQEPLLSQTKLRQWLDRAKIRNKIRFSTYLPPHLFYLLGPNINYNLLKITDSIFNKLPLIKTFGGAIIAEGIKI